MPGTVYFRPTKPNPDNEKGVTKMMSDNAPMAVSGRASTYFARETHEEAKVSRGHTGDSAPGWLKTYSHKLARRSEKSILAMLRCEPGLPITAADLAKASPADSKIWGAAPDPENGDDFWAEHYGAEGLHAEDFWAEHYGAEEFYPEDGLHYDDFYYEDARPCYCDPRGFECYWDWD